MSNKGFKRATVYHDICIICSSKLCLKQFDCQHCVCHACQEISKQFDKCAFCEPIRKTRVENLEQDKGCWNFFSYYSRCLFIKYS
jgi:hypothetical protein